MALDEPLPSDIIFSLGQGLEARVSGADELYFLDTILDWHPDQGFVVAFAG